MSLLFIECLTEKYEPKGEREKADTNEKSSKKKNKSKWCKDFKVLGFLPLWTFLYIDTVHASMFQTLSTHFTFREIKGRRGRKGYERWIMMMSPWWWPMTSVFDPHTNCHFIYLHFLISTTFIYLLKLVVKFFMLVLDQHCKHKTDTVVDT